LGKDSDERNARCDRRRIVVRDGRSERCIDPHIRASVGGMQHDGRRDSHQSPVARRLLRRSDPVARFTPFPDEGISRLSDPKYAS
jgi:hypothetical protein